MDGYGGTQEGSRPDPSREWAAPGPGTGPEGESGYPERPEEPNCIYYLRTGFCEYGARCRFNHPRDRAAVLGTARAGGESFPKRAGQPVCQYYMRTGMCKFGASCKYHHQKQEADSSTNVSLNYHGYPLRPGEKECSYYMKTGQCKFGATCKFHHPQPANVQGPYGSLVLSPGVSPPWTPYPAPASPVASAIFERRIGSGTMYGLALLSPSAPGYTGAYLPGPSSPGPSTSTQKESPFPERPGQPECQYYMTTGDCKYGASCRYHHPLELVVPKTNVVLSPLGLPLRPGAPPCTHYTQHGHCKFGAACRFDHPMQTLSCSPSAFSLADMPVAPYPVGSSMGTLTPSSSSSDLRQELNLGSSVVSGVSRMSLSTSISSSLIASTKSEPNSQTGVCQSGQGLALSTDGSGSSSGAEQNKLQ